MADLQAKITTPRAMEFWSSSNKCNQVRAIIAFSADEGEALRDLQRHGYSYLLRKQLLADNIAALNNPSMDGIPFALSSGRWSNCKYEGVVLDIVVRWELSTPLLGSTSLTNFVNGDYLYVIGTGTLTDHPATFVVGKIYRYNGVNVDGVSIDAILTNDANIFTEVSDTPNSGWDVSQTVGITDISPLDPPQSSVTWVDATRWVDTNAWPA